MTVIVFVLFVWFACKVIAETKSIPKLTDLSPACFIPDPFEIPECFASCPFEDHHRQHWGVDLEEVDYDPNLDATIFTYSVRVWEAAVCTEPVERMDSIEAEKQHHHSKHYKNRRIKNHHSQSKKSNNKMKSDADMMNSNELPIEGLYILFDGCCGEYGSPLKASISTYFTKAITPKHEFEFLEGGWYWGTLIYPEYENDFGFMVHGDVGITTGTFCVRTGYYCICQPIAVPDLCKNQWMRKDNWAKLDESISESIQERPIWAKNYDL